MLAKPWWPEPRYELPLAAALDPLVVFRHLVLCLARRAGLSPQAQTYALAATNSLVARNLRPDLARQAKAWVNHHRHPPRRIRVRRILRLAAIRPIVSRPSYAPPPARLAREALVTRLRAEDHRSFKDIAVRLGTTREQARQLYARALRRQRQPLLAAGHTISPCSLSGLSPSCANDS